MITTLSFSDDLRRSDILTLRRCRITLLCVYDVYHNYRPLLTSYDSPLTASSMITPCLFVFICWHCWDCWCCCRAGRARSGRSSTPWPSSRPTSRTRDWSSGRSWTTSSQETFLITNNVNAFVFSSLFCYLSIYLSFLLASFPCLYLLLCNAIFIQHR